MPLGEQPVPRGDIMQKQQPLCPLLTVPLLHLPLQNLLLGALLARSVNLSLYICCLVDYVLYCCVGVCRATCVVCGVRRVHPITLI